jgi:hypothetical protein
VRAARLLLPALLFGSLVAGVASSPAAASQPASLDLAARASIDALAVAQLDAPASTPGAGADYRSPARAFFLSMLLPGLGQRYAGHPKKAVAFYIGEAALWTSFAVFKIQGNVREEDFENWAQQFASAKVDGYDRDEDYFQTISRYLSSDDYNLEIKVLARLVHPDSRADQLAYIDEFSIRGDDTWEWASPERRNDFRVIRHRALDADRYANWTLGGLVLLRVLSGIDAALGARHANHLLDEADLSWSPRLPSGEPGVAVAISRSF